MKRRKLNNENNIQNDENLNLSNVHNKRHKKRKRNRKMKKKKVIVNNDDTVREVIIKNNNNHNIKNEKDNDKILTKEQFLKGEDY